MAVNVCQHCATPIAPHRRSDARYCDAPCRSAARHARTALSTQASERGRGASAAAEACQRRAGTAEAPSAAYSVPPEWQWLATYYASRRYTRDAAT